MVAFFDLDRTLIPQHTALLYLQLSMQEGLAGWWTLAQASLYAFLYFFNIIDIEGVARETIKRGAGDRELDVAARGERCVRELVLPRLSKLALDRVEQHRQQGHYVCIVSASPVYVVQPIAQHLRMDCICTRLGVAEGVLTGELDGPLCYGPHKVHAARHYASNLRSNLEACFFYTDSASDLPLMEVVGHPVAVNPDPRLRRVAKRRGWGVVHFH